MSGEVSFKSAPLVGLLLVMILAPLASADPYEADLELRIDITESVNGLYYSDSSELEVTIRVKNHANQARELVYNPACPFDLVISGDAWRMDLDDERVCPEQSRAMAIQPGQERILSTWNWDWGNAPSGDLQFAFSQSEAELQALEHLTLQRSVAMPENLRLNAILAETLGDELGHTASMPAMIYLSLDNVGNDLISLPFDAQCRVQTVLLTDLSCGTGEIGAGEHMALGWISWDFDGAEDGDVTVPISLAGVTGSDTSIQTTYMHTPTDHFPQLIPSVTIDINDALEWYFTLDNMADVPAKLVFEDACIAEAHVLAPNGEIVYDSRGTRLCPDTGFEQKIGPQTTYNVVSEQWDFIGSNGCEIGDGMHLLVVTQPDHDIVATQSFEYKNSGENPACGLDLQDDSSLQLRVDNLAVFDADGANERIAFQVTIANTGMDGFDFYWPTDCALKLELSLVGEAPERTWYEGCDALGGQRSTIDSLQSYTWPTMTVPFAENGQEVKHGNWQISIETTSLPTFRAQLAHSYDGVYLQEIVSEDTVEETAQEVEQPTEDVVEPLILDGDWNYVTTSVQGCWLLTDSSGSEHSFVAHMQDGGWIPQPGLSGSYVVESSKSSGSCSIWSGIIILQTLDETETAPQINTPVEPLGPKTTPVDEIVELAPATVTVVATTSLSIMGLLYLGNTEWIRIPALQVGIGLVGMVRRNGEHDGEYQRGRIMGYLTANPGVHFRALLGALSMSNGQLTHHLKHLEGEERIWRRKDGRLVRFYPATIQSNLNEEDLPIPLLTPDPNSLQGKILRLLDATENDIVNLSQKELAIRLEASQQLISHHLRTLEKFGLVEREKVGMRYRYQLTREAIFLLNSNEYDISTE